MLYNMWVIPGALAISVHSRVRPRADYAYPVAKRQCRNVIYFIKCSAHYPALGRRLCFKKHKRKYSCLSH